MPQIMGSGAAVFDFDNDGRLDVFAVDGGESPDSGVLLKSSGRLFRQFAAMQFVDVTQHSEFSPLWFGMGAAVGDMDDDGDLDMYVTGYGPDRLYENNGDGTFSDVTESSGIENPRWSSAACFFDYDRDGHLDLFVANYLDYSPGSRCQDSAGRPDYCGPTSFPGTVDRMFHNEGHRGEAGPVVFSDVSAAAGFGHSPGKGLGVLCRDFTDDGRCDVYVANDMEPNFLWVQQTDGTFRDEALLRGCAVNQLAEAEASMGVVSGDLNEDGRMDVFLTHLSGETNTLFCVAAGGYFEDRTAQSGLGPPSLPYTGFGVAAVDVDHDGDLDLAITNGRVRRGSQWASTSGDHWRPYVQRNQFYLNQGHGDFSEESDVAGGFGRGVGVGRGIASGDFDGDGDMDLLTTAVSAPARIYMNEAPKSGNWLIVRLIDSVGNRFGIGAEITLSLNGRHLHREINPSSGYLVSNDHRAHFGTGDVNSFDSILVRWPDGDGTLEEFPGGALGRSIVLMRGTGVPSSENVAP